ncbi:MAG: CBS domain-containing protein, partial [Ktedonobacterales bacterium]
FLPNQGPGFWPMVSMGAILGGTMRSPFTGVIFIVELTHDVNSLLPLLIAAICGHAFTVLTLRRSILTEKVARRGYHLSREYATDPLEILFAREVMRTNIVAFSSTAPLSEVAGRTRPGVAPRGQHLFPVFDADGLLAGVVTRASLHDLLNAGDVADRRVADVMNAHPVVAHAEEPLRAVVYRMAKTGFTRFPVVEHAGSRKLVGMISLTDLLKGRAFNLEAEERRERVLALRAVFPRLGQRRARKAPVDAETSVAPTTSTSTTDPRP